MNRQSPPPAPTKSQDLERRSDKHSTAKGEKTSKTKKPKSTPRMHSFDRDFKDGKYYKNPDVTRKTPSYMRQTCASLTKVKTFRNNGTSPGPEPRNKSSLNPLAEDDEHDSQFHTDSEEDFSGDGGYDFNEENEEDETERSLEEENDTEVRDKGANLEETKLSSSPQSAVHEESQTGKDAKLNEVVKQVETECLVTVAPNQHETQNGGSTDDASKTKQEASQNTNSQNAEILNMSSKTEENEAKTETQKDGSLSSVQKNSSIDEEMQEYVETPIDQFRASKPREISGNNLQPAVQSTQEQSKDTQSTSENPKDNLAQTLDSVQGTSNGTASGDHSGLRQRPGKSKPEGQDHDEGSSSGIEADTSKTVVENNEICTYISNSTLRTIGAGVVAGFFGAALLLLGVCLASKQNN